MNIDLSGGPLAPGKTDEGPNSVSDIETVLFLYHGTNTVWVTGSSGDDNIQAGVTFINGVITRGINLNAGAEQGKVDDYPDVSYEETNPPNPAYAEPIILDGGEGNDTLDASGGAGFDLDPRTFSAASSRPNVSRVSGTRVSYRLSEAASVTFEIQSAGAGRRVGSRCVRPTTKNRRARPCRRSLRVRGTFVGSGVSGVNRMHFNGQVAGRRLRPGRYRLCATARDLAGNRSRPRTASFTIVR